MIRTALASIHESEEGHVAPHLGTVTAGLGAILLGIGSANDSGMTAIVGSVVLAVGIFAYGFIHHGTIDKDFYGRIDKLNGK